MPAIHYSFIATISASRLSSRMKLVLIILCSHAQAQDQLQISVKSLTGLTSTSERHLRRILHELAAKKLINIEYRKGLTSVYHFPDNYQVKNGELQAIWNDSSVESINSDILSVTPKTHSQPVASIFSPSAAPLQHNIPKEVDPAMISAWQKYFGIRYRPRSLEEQQAMDWMIYAQQNNKLCEIKSPIGFLKKIVVNGHPDDFPSFSERKRKTKVRAEMDEKQEQKAVKQIEESWQRYINLPESRQTKLARRFQSEVIEKTKMRKVQDLFQKEGLDNIVIRSLFRTYIHERLGDNRKSNKRPEKGQSAIRC